MNYIDDIKQELAKHIKVGKGLMNAYTILVLVKGEDCTLEDVHDAWAVNINGAWDTEANGAHRSLVWFNELSVETQEKDRPFMEAIQTTARVIKERHELS